MGSEKVQGHALMIQMFSDFVIAEHVQVWLEVCCEKLGVLEKIIAS